MVDSSTECRSRAVSGDTNPNDWGDMQFVTVTGTIVYRTARGQILTDSGVIRLSADNPNPLSIYMTDGIFDWLDAPGLQNPGFLRDQFVDLVSAQVTFNFVSILQYQSPGPSCGVDWGLNLTVKNGQATWKFF